MPKTTKLKKLTAPRLLARKGKKKIVMVTAYDATFAHLVEKGGAEMVLVGDSLGMVIQGHDTTLPVTLDDVVYHCRAVSRGLSRAHLCGDMPFMSYKASTEQALMAAGRLIQQGRAQSVKLEGGTEIAPTIRAIVSAGIPVVGHVGLTPQSVHSLGGHKMQGKKAPDQLRILEDAKAVADAGAFCLVLESMPAELAATITQEVSIPTIGIGAGPYCDGQVLVIYDMLGMNDEFSPKFLKHYAHLGSQIESAVAQYASEVQAGEFPGPEHTVFAEEAEDANSDNSLYSSGRKGLPH